MRNGFFSNILIQIKSYENNFPKKQGFKEFLMNNNFSYFDRMGIIGIDEIFYNNKYYKF